MSDDTVGSENIFIQIVGLGNDTSKRASASALYERLKTLAQANPNNPQMRWFQCKAATFLSINTADDEIGRIQGVSLYNDVLLLNALFPSERAIESSRISIAINVNTYKVTGDEESNRLGLLQHYGKLRAQNSTGSNKTRLEEAQAASQLTILLAAGLSTRSYALSVYEELKQLANTVGTEEVFRCQADGAFGLAYYLVNSTETIGEARRLYLELRSLTVLASKTKALANLGLLLIPRIAAYDLGVAQEIQAHMDELANREPVFADLAFTSGVAMLAWMQASLAIKEPTRELLDGLRENANLWEVLVNRLLPNAKGELKTSIGELRVLHLQALVGFLAAATFGAALSGRMGIVEALQYYGDSEEAKLAGRSARLLYYTAMGERTNANRLLEQEGAGGQDGRRRVLALANLTEHAWFRS